MLAVVLAREPVYGETGSHLNPVLPGEGKRLVETP